MLKSSHAFGLLLVYDIKQQFNNLDGPVYILDKSHKYYIVSYVQHDTSCNINNLT